MADIRDVEQMVPFSPVQIPVDPESATGGMGFSLGSYYLPLVGSHGAPTWWSASRDLWIRRFVTKSDPLKVAVETFINKTVSIPVSVTARDTTIKRHNDLAAELMDNMMHNSGFMQGFEVEFKKFVYDYLTQDNGAFMLVLWRGPIHRPIVGAALGMLQLDSARCQRTGDPEFPVVYLHTDGKRYAIHMTRLIMLSNLPSPEADMYGVGQCAVSCAIDSAQELSDIFTYSAEKFGSRPPRQILYVRRGATIAELTGAVRVFEEKMDSQELRRFSKTLLLAPKNASQELNLDKIDLANVPDGFDREKTTVLDMALLAAAFGLDLRDLSVSFGVSGQTRGTAEVEAKKGRGKGPHELLESFTKAAGRRFLPDSLVMKFDNMDDDADEQEADIRDKRSVARERDLRAGVTQVRTERMAMVKRGEISQQDFNWLEIQDGRTPDGLDLMLLFHSKDPDYAELLGGLSDGDPTDLAANDPVAMCQKLQERVIMVFNLVERSGSERAAVRLRIALGALTKLKTMYEGIPAPGIGVNSALALEAMDAGAAASDATGGSQGDTAVPPDDPTRIPPGDAEQPEQEDLDDAGDDDAAQEKQVSFSPDLPEEEMSFLESSISDYEAQFSDLVERALRGEIPQDELSRLLGDIIGAILLLLFLRGARLSASGLNDGDDAALGSIVAANTDALEGFVRDIYAGRYGPERLTLAGALQRIGVWGSMAVAAYTAGQLQRRDDPYLRWSYGPTEHCSDCYRLNGQVHRASEWKQAGWLPRSMRLECHGFHCQCILVETTGPSSGNF